MLQGAELFQGWLDFFKLDAADASLRHILTAIASSACF